MKTKVALFLIIAGLMVVLVGCGEGAFTRGQIEAKAREQVEQFYDASDSGLCSEIIRVDYYWILQAMDFVTDDPADTKYWQDKLDRIESEQNECYAKDNE